MLGHHPVLCWEGAKALEQEKLLLPKPDVSETSTPRVPSGKMSHCPVPAASSTGTRCFHTPVGLLSPGWVAEQGGGSSLGYTAQDFSQQDP